MQLFQFVIDEYKQATFEGDKDTKEKYQHAIGSDRLS
jgi:hypothetical protein